MDPTELSLGELYAQALLESLPEDAQAEPVAEELEALWGVIESIPQARNLLSGWAMPAEDRAALVKRIFAGRLSKPAESLLAVLNRRNRMSILDAVVSGFRKLLNVRQGKIDVLLTTATPLEAGELEAIQQGLGQSLSKKATVRARVDERLVGGAVLRVGDRVYDASIRSQLHKIREQMTARKAGLKIHEE